MKQAYNKPELAICITTVEESFTTSIIDNTEPELEWDE